MEGYCLHCRERVGLQTETVSQMLSANGRYMCRGVCAKDGETVVTVFHSKEWIGRNRRKGSPTASSDGLGTGSGGDDDE